jgi:hypothetical protein
MNMPCKGKISSDFGRPVSYWLILSTLSLTFCVPHKLHIICGTVSAAAYSNNVVRQHPVAFHLLFLCYLPSHIQTCVKILKSKFLKFKNYFHITVALHVSTNMVIIRCFEIAVEIAALPSISSNSKYTLVYAPMCCGAPVTCNSKLC